MYGITPNREIKISYPEIIMPRSDETNESADSVSEHLYTTPAVTWGPSYGPPPHTFSSATYVKMVARAPPGVLAKLVAYPLVCTTDLFTVFWACVNVRADAERHVYHQVHVLDFALPVTYRGVKGNQCTIEYIDSSMGQVVGRELWGYPKKRGTFNWQEMPDGFNLRCFAEDGALLAESVIALGAKNAPNTAEWPTELADYRDAPTLQVMVSRKLGTNAPVRADVIRIDKGPPTDGKVYPAASYRSATGTLKLHNGPLDPLTTLGPLDVVAVSVGFDISFNFPHGVPIGSATLPAPTDAALTGVPR